MSAYGATGARRSSREIHPATVLGRAGQSAFRRPVFFGGGLSLEGWIDGISCGFAVVVVVLPCLLPRLSHDGL